MDRRRAMDVVRWTSGLLMVAGLWLVVAPLAVGYTVLEEPLWNDIAVGLAVALVALIRFRAPLGHEGVGWAALVLGVWLLFAPFSLGYTEDTAIGVTAEGATWNDVVVGAVVLALAGLGLNAAGRATADVGAASAAVAPIPLLRHGGD